MLQAYHQELVTILLNYHISRIVLALNQEQYDQCGNSTE